MGRTSLQRYPLPLRKLLPVCRSAVSSTVAGCADATKRGEGVVADSLIIDVNQPRGNPLAQGQTAIEVVFQKTPDLSGPKNERPYS